MERLRVVGEAAEHDNTHAISLNRYRPIQRTPSFKVSANLVESVDKGRRKKRREILSRRMYEKMRDRLPCYLVCDGATVDTRSCENRRIGDLSTDNYHIVLLYPGRGLFCCGYCIE